MVFVMKCSETLRCQVARSEDLEDFRRQEQGWNRVKSAVKSAVFHFRDLAGCKCTANDCKCRRTQREREREKHSISWSERFCELWCFVHITFFTRNFLPAEVGIQKFRPRLWSSTADRSTPQEESHEMSQDTRAYQGQMSDGIGQDLVRWDKDGQGGIKNDKLRWWFHCIIVISYKIYVNIYINIYIYIYPRLPRPFKQRWLHVDHRTAWTPFFCRFTEALLLIVFKNQFWCYLVAFSEHACGLSIFCDSRKK